MVHTVSVHRVHTPYQFEVCSFCVCGLFIPCLWFVYSVFVVCLFCVCVLFILCLRLDSSHVPKNAIFTQLLETAAILAKFCQLFWRNFGFSETLILSRRRSEKEGCIFKHETILKIIKIQQTNKQTNKQTKSNQTCRQRGWLGAKHTLLDRQA